MKESTVFIDIIILSGFLQCLLLSAVCLIKGRHKSQTALSLFLFCLSLEILVQSTIFINLIIEYPILLPFFNSLPCFLAFLFYLYFYFSFYQNYIPRVPILIHSIPGIISILLLLGAYILKGEEFLRSAFIEALDGKLPPIQSIIFLFQISLGFVYLFFITRLFYLFRKELGRLKRGKKLKRWFVWIIISVTSTWIAVFIVGIYSHFAEASSAVPIIKTIVQTLFFLWLVYMVTAFALSHPFILQHKEISETMRVKLNILDDEVVKHIKNLKKLMEEDELFLDPNLSLQSLAKKLGTNPNVLSFVINEKFASNFSNYINSYRVEKFIIMAQNKDAYNNTFLGLALDAGFRSKATFNRAFKEIKNTTPSQYLKKTEKVCLKS